MFLGVLGVGIAGVVVGAAAVRGVGDVVGFVAAGAGAAAAAIALVARCWGLYGYGMSGGQTIS